MNESKKSLRDNLLERRQALSRTEVEDASRRVLVQIPAALDWGTVQTAHIYRSVSGLGEINTLPIIEWINREHPDIKLSVGQASPDAPLPRARFDVIIVPVLGFDIAGYRLGMGGGWYDRWLATQPNSLKIGLAYAWAKIQNLPREPHDIPLDVMITD